MGGEVIFKIDFTIARDRTVDGYIGTFSFPIHLFDHAFFEIGILLVEGFGWFYFVF